MLDVTFGNRGKVVTQINDTSTANDIAIQPDGKIVVGGTATLSGKDYFTLIRYNLDGSLDNTFGSAGKVLTLIKDKSTISSIAIQPDGKIVAGGKAYNNDINILSDSGYVIARFRANGNIDSLFGLNGITTVKMPDGMGELKKLIIKPDGKILTAGTFFTGTFENIPVLVQLNSNGSLDSTFGANGKVVGYIEDIELFTDMALAKDGKILVTGQTKNWGYIGDFNLLRFLPNGVRDNSFGQNGIVRTDLNDNRLNENKTETPQGLIVLPDSSIVVTGYNTTRPATFTIVKYRTNGSLDNSFGSGGKVITPVDTLYAYAKDILADQAGNLFVTGHVSRGGNNLDFNIAKYYSNGRLDSSFGKNGIDTTNFLGFSDVAFASALQTDGKIVLAGSAGTNSSQYSIGLARYAVVVLPLKLLGFTALKEGKSNLLQWTTAHEINVEKFEIERSPDGVQYKNIGTVKAGAGQYSFTDNNPRFSGTNYYRLKMIDKDGKFEYSPVRVLNNSSSFYVSVYPLPAKGRLNIQIQSSKNEKATISITDISGKVLITNSTSLSEGINNSFINIQSLSKGIYFLKVVTSEITEKKKIMVGQ